MVESKQQGSVLWMDPCFQSGRPTTQSLFQALPSLLDKGWQVELWCLAHDQVDDRVKVVLLPRAAFLRLLEPLWFWLVAWCRLTWSRLRGVNWDIVHTTGPDIPGADVMSLHFHNRTWIGLQSREPAHSIKERLRVFHTMIGWAQETLTLNSKRWRVILPVSEGLATRIRPQLSVQKQVRVLPNVLDTSRFNPGVRTRWRDTLREEIHAMPQDYIFVFVSTGHYQRKGLWHAVKALNSCRLTAQEELGLNLRFLVVGAGERAQSSLIPRLDQTAANWREWLQLIPPTQQVERWYAGADAFLFPSLYETFSLVALEASACGLPLLITAYDGHEMYLEEGVNGCILPEDTEGMSTRILQFLRKDRHQMNPGPAHFIQGEGYADVLDQTYLEVMNSRPS
ncbi:MAG: glycosyltransferase family 4 protein [Prosthecobacter sp.]|nr:glycosyltransferase family 4 protein [Prosthecobacter sp.]